jgi:2-C-methyl-D-erythritol 2,4-cyclodiphosphate synthase
MTESTVYQRVGYGYDVHRLVAGRKLVLGGVEVPSAKGLDGHSDADVLSHAIADALLGAAALGDIGQHFPNTDPHYRGISSLLLVGRAAQMVRDHGFTIVNIDSTLLLERPKILPFVPQMTKNLAEALGIGEDCVSIKATTGEGLGFVGADLGAAAHAVAAVVKTS